MQEDLQKLPPGFPRGAVPQPHFPLLAPTMGQMHTFIPTQSLQPTQQLEYKVQSDGLVLLLGDSLGIRKPLETVQLQHSPCAWSKCHPYLCLCILQEQSLLQPPTLQLLNGMGPLGRRASDGGANIQLHAQLLKRPRGPSPLVTSPVRTGSSVYMQFVLFLLMITDRMLTGKLISPSTLSLQ